IIFVVFVFFFQAEDGIRAPLVTGVQTCALPISLLLVTSMVPVAIRLAFFQFRGATAAATAASLTAIESVIPRDVQLENFVGDIRSEERRVGKECRFRLCRDHCTKKTRL